jgi:uncharacterized membrane-anchored protein
MTPAARSLRKVPEITVAFWITKILTTAMGESVSDYSIRVLGPALAISIGGTLFLAALIAQFVVRRYIAGVYWFAIVMVSIFGTMVADSLHVGLGVPYWAAGLGFATILALVFVFWRLSQKSLSIHSIITTPREFFYWAAVLSTFALGTSLGDLTAYTFHLGVLISGIMFIVIILLPLIAWWKFKLNPIFAFWFAYVTTRPLGASFADYGAILPEHGGLGLGTGTMSLILSSAVLVFVVYLGITQNQNARRARPEIAEA